MKRLSLSIAVVALAALACGLSPAVPTIDFNQVETQAAASLTAGIPTQSPPTLIPLPIFTSAPTAIASPTATPFPTFPASGRPVRVEFATGAVSARVGGSVYFPDRRQYILYAFKGQQMTVQIESDGNANFAIYGVEDNQSLKRFDNEDRTWTGILPETQDYMIQVAVPTKSANFILTITIIWL